MSSFTSKLEGLLKSRSVTGLECVLSSEGIQEINYVVLKKEKNRLFTESSKSSLATIEELKATLSSTHPVLLVLNGKGIIHKKFPYSEGENENSLLNKIFPGANSNDFYMQKVISDDGSNIISVIRKSSADTVLNELRKQGYDVINCSLGPFCFQSMLPLLDNNSTSREVAVSGYKLSLATNGIANFEPTSSSNTDLKLIGGEEVKKEFVVSFASAVQYFISFGREVSTTIPDVKEGKEEFRQKKIFKMAGLSALIFFVAALLINFILFLHFSKKHNEYDEKVALNQDMLQQYETLKLEVGQKQAFLEKTGLLEASRTSYYADKIAVDIPESIQLAQMNIFPLEKKSNTDEQDMSFIPKDILISGLCKRSTELNEWMGILKKKEWIKDVSIVNYAQDKSENTGRFSIEIMMK